MSRKVFPAIHGTQNGVDFYLTTLSYSEVDHYVKLPHEYLGAELLSPELSMQRELNTRRVLSEMVPYLIREDAFYSALTLFVLPPGRPEPMELGVSYRFRAIPRPAGQEEEFEDDQEIGELVIRDDFVLFPGDGQHRAASIREVLRDVKAMRQDPDLPRVRVPVVLIPYETRPKAQQLFADLNLHAKQPNRSIGISFEHRDPRALATKGMIPLVDLFRGDGVNHRATSLPVTAPQVITLNTLNQANDVLLNALKEVGLTEDIDEATTERHADLSPAELDAKHQERERLIREAAEQLTKVWDVVVASTPQWDEVRQGLTKPGELRRQFVFAHGVGWLATAHAAGAVIRANKKGWPRPLEQVLAGVDWSRGNSELQNIALIGERVNNTAPGIRSLAGYILFRSDEMLKEDAAEPYLRQYVRSLSRGQRKEILDFGTEGQQVQLLRLVDERDLPDLLEGVSDEQKERLRAAIDRAA